MDHLRQLAEAFYRASPSEIQSEAHKFFNALDSDGDGHIDQKEFISLMSEEKGFHRLSNPSFFNVLDTDRNGTLDFWEVMTLFYIVHSGRPFCDSCGEFIPATYFTCVDCAAVNACIRCYENRRSKHDHHGQPAVFVDNYILLEDKKSSPCYFNSNTDDDVVNNVVSSPATPNTTTAKPNTTTETPNTTTAKPNTTAAKPNTTTARPNTTAARPNTYERPRPNSYNGRPRPNNTHMAQAANYEECRLAIDAFQLALNIGNTCSIM